MLGLSRKALQRIKMLFGVDVEDLSSQHKKLVELLTRRANGMRKAKKGKKVVQGGAELQAKQTRYQTNN